MKLITDIFNIFKVKDVPFLDKESVLGLANKDTARISYTNVYGDEEACQLVDWSFEPRSTGNTRDITRYYLYDNTILKYIIRIESRRLVYYNLSDDNVIASMDKEFLNQVTSQLGL